MLSRRLSLKLGLFALIATFASKATSQPLEGKKIVFAGAGIAGLAAAKQLQTHGANVVVLEAENYVGGRIKTDSSMGVPFEFGADWLHEPNHKNPI